MIVVPTPTPPTTPVALIVPAAVLLLLQAPVPPEAVGLVNNDVVPTHSGPAPIIAPALGDTFTVTIVVVNTDPHDALVSVNVIIVVPPLTPYTTPVVAPTVPTVVLLLVHAPVPPDAVASLKVMVNPVHTVPGPVIVPAKGDTFTNTLAVVVADPQKALVSV